MGDCKPLHIPTCEGDLGIFVSSDINNGVKFRSAHHGVSEHKPETTEFVNLTQYHSAVGVLNYAAVATQPDLLFVVSFLSCFMSKPTKAGKFSNMYYTISSTRFHILLFFREIQNTPHKFKAFLMPIMQVTV